MGRSYRAALAAIGVLFATSPAFADDEASNRPLVVASEYGNCYAKSIPYASYGNEGQTRVYVVENGDDTIAATFDWYSNRLHLECNVADSSGATAISVVEFGPWARGQEATDDVLALAFYWNGRLLRRYSTLDIAGTPNNVIASVSHYSVVEEVIGYQWADGNRYRFSIRTIDNRTITFDAGAGTIISSIATQTR